MVNLLVKSPEEESKSLAEMDLIKLGEGRPIVRQDECTLNGILIDTETKIEGDTISRQDVRLDTLGVFSNLHLAWSVSLDLPVRAEFYQDDEGDMFLFIMNEWNFGLGLQMRASITGIDGIAVGYNVYEGAYANNTDIAEGLEKFALQEGIELRGKVVYRNKRYTVDINDTFDNLEAILNSISSSYCDFFTVGTIENNNDNSRISIPVSRADVAKFPPWFWPFFVFLAVISFLTAVVSMCEFGDAEKLVILSRDIKASYQGGDLNCIATPISDLSEEVNLGFSRIDTTHVRFGHLVEREQCVVHGDDTIGGWLDPPGRELGENIEAKGGNNIQAAPEAAPAASTQARTQASTQASTQTSSQTDTTQG